MAGQSQAFSATHAAWRFLYHDRVRLEDLVEPLREVVGRQAFRSTVSDYVLLVHDWSKIDYKSHSSKHDLRQITHEHDIGYEMSTSLLVDVATGASIAPMQIHLKTGDAVHSTAQDPPAVDVHRLDELTPTLQESEQWEDRSCDRPRGRHAWADASVG